MQGRPHVRFDERDLETELAGPPRQIWNSTSVSDRGNKALRYAPMPKRRANRGMTEKEKLAAATEAKADPGPSSSGISEQSLEGKDFEALPKPLVTFDPSRLERKIITIPLAKQIEEQEKIKPGSLYKVIIDLNLTYHGGRDGARARVFELLKVIVAEASVPGIDASEEEGINSAKSEFSDQYLFGRFTAKTLYALVAQDKSPVDTATAPQASAQALPVRRTQSAIYLIWPDFAIGARLTKSVSTVKADAARLSFSANGSGIVWAVLDSGIQGDHVHFVMHNNLAPTGPLAHRDFTAVGKSAEERPLEDPYGHGTHVAGIIAGELRATPDRPILAISRQQENEKADPQYQRINDIETISGVAPRCRLLSLRVLDEKGEGDVSSLIAAIGYIQQLNGDGRHLLIHGVNISAGYQFYPEWFACGQSPVCVEVDRLVKSGVVVVVAAGNTGYAYEQVFTTKAAGAGSAVAGQSLSINDPGNAELAITVGSTHREMPHVYGVSYFSSKGPTGDGRCKPDLVAPGEKILSCAAGETRAERLAHVADPEKGCDYAEDTGTSMAAPHVSGVIAAFLSIRREFLGRSEEVKQIFMSTATDLGRDRYFQGKGLVDLMRAIQSI
jgi:serine protease AprX